MLSYEKWEQNNTVLVNSETTSDALKISKLVASGYLLVVTQSYNPATEKLGVFTFTASERSWEVVPLTQEELSTIANRSLEGHLISLLTEANAHVGQHIDASEKAHWMGVADAIARKQSLWIADQLGGEPNPVLYPALTSTESSTWETLATIQLITASIRDAAAAIEQELYLKTNEEILALDSTWVSTHILWP